MRLILPIIFILNSLVPLGAYGSTQSSSFSEKQFTELELKSQHILFKTSLAIKIKKDVDKLKEEYSLISNKKVNEYTEADWIAFAEYAFDKQKEKRLKRLGTSDLSEKAFYHSIY